MAKMYMCDRCGKEMDLHNIWRIRCNVKYVKLVFRDDEMRGYAYELCGECGKELLSWLKGAKKVEP